MEYIWPEGRIRLFAYFASHNHHCADLPKVISLSSLFSPRSFMQLLFMWLCVFNLIISLLMIERISILHLIIIIKSKI